MTAQKMDMWLTEFTDDAKAGIPEMNYYFQEIPGRSPFYNCEGNTRCYALVDDDQFDRETIRDERGMLSLRQEWQTWSYTEKGDVQPFGGITLDCVRMTLYKFYLTATSLTPEERRTAQLPPELQPEAVRAKLGTPEFPEALLAREHALYILRMQEEEENRDSYRPRRAFTHRYSRW